jgi:hypothetical protein
MRDRLQRHLRREVPDEIWDDLVRLDYVGDAADPGGWANLVTETKRFLRYVDLGVRSRAPRRKPAAAKDATIEAHGRALGAWAARFARGDMFVGLREPWLEVVRGYLGGVFGRADAIAHLHSVAWMLVPVPDLVARKPTDRLSPNDTPRIRGTKARVVGDTDEAVDGTPGVHLDIELRFGQVVREVSVWQPLRARSVSVEIPGGAPVRAIAAAGTLNERLLGLATQIRSGPLTVPQTLWLILTDEPPEVRPLSVDVRQEWGLGAQFRNVIAIEAEPWIPGHAVAAAYREVQAECLRGPNRPARERTLELARFLAVEGRDLSIREQMRTWNELYPAWVVHDAGNFRTNARRAMALL